MQTLREQLRLACLGNKDVVQQLQTQTGVKDKVAQFWIEHLLALAREQQDVCMKDTVTRDPRLNDKAIKGDARKTIKLQITAVIQDDLWNRLLELPPNKGINRPLDLIAGFHYNILLASRGE